MYASATGMEHQQKTQTFHTVYGQDRERTFLVLHLLNVGTGSKHLVTTGDDDSPHTLICLGLLKLGVESIEQGRAQRVEGLGPVKGQDGYVVRRRTRGDDELFCRGGHGADSESVCRLGRLEESAS